jgi:hypothetical protein
MISYASCHPIVTVRRQQVTTNVIAALAAAGLLTAGVASAAGTRSSVAIPAARLAGIAAPHNAAVARQSDRPDCTLTSNASLPACANPGRSGEVLGAEGAHHGVSAAVLAVLAAGGIGAVVAVAGKNDSNG